jgi:hypothetical protein
MSQSNRAVYVAGLALALSIYAVARGPRGVTSTGAAACVDPEARDQLGALRREVAAHDVMIRRPAPIADSAERAGSAAVATAGEPVPPAPSPASARPRYARFETANPAVSVTQNADGGYEIHNTDPALAGSVIQVTAVAPSGEQTPVLIRIPQ